MPNLTERERQLVDLIRTFWVPPAVHAHAPLRWGMEAYDNKAGFFQIYIMAKDFKGNAPAFVECFLGIKILPGEVKIQLFFNRGYEERVVLHFTYDVNGDDLKMRNLARFTVKNAMSYIRAMKKGLEIWAKKNDGRGAGEPGTLLIDVQ